MLEHQKRAKVEILDKLNLNKLCILEGETRSGKTLTALSCALEYVGKAPFLFLTTKKALGGVKGDWKQLIQPLNKGSYNVYQFIKTVKEHGFTGPFGLQGYGIGGDVYRNLHDSMNAWRRMNLRLIRELD